MLLIFHYYTYSSGEYTFVQTPDHTWLYQLRTYSRAPISCHLNFSFLNLFQPKRWDSTLFSCLCFIFTICLCLFIGYYCVLFCEMICVLWTLKKKIRIPFSKSYLNHYIQTRVQTPDLELVGEALQQHIDSESQHMNLRWDIWEEHRWSGPPQ